MGFFLGYGFFDGISQSKRRVLETNPGNTYMCQNETEKTCTFDGISFQKVVPEN